MNKVTSKLKQLLNIKGVKLDLLTALWLAAPIMIWFSYQPVISLGQTSSMNLELSLSLIYVAILALASLPVIWRRRRTLARSGLVRLLLIFVIWSGMTVIWSSNKLRGLLTLGVTGALYLVFLGVLARREKLKRLLPALVKILLAMTAIMCVLALAQILAGIWVTNRGDILLCLGCTANQFGFVRPNVFAIEPQFFGNLLLLPGLILLNRLLTEKWRPCNVSLFILITATIVLTLSRGAIYAFAVGACIILIVRRKAWRQGLASTGVMIAAGLIALTVQGIAAWSNPSYNESFWGAVAKSANHLSLGIIDFRPQDAPRPSGGSKKTPNYDGYVAESTNVRVNLTATAIKVWQNSPKNMLIGTGLGSAGVEMARELSSGYQKEIVQNEFIEVLMERGLVGLVIMITLLVCLAKSLIKNKWLWGVIVAYLVQWLFFSGLPNALHIYLAVALTVTLLGAAPRNNLPGGLKQNLNV